MSTDSNIKLFNADQARDSGGGGMVEVASTRAAQEVQAAMVIAKKYPRDENRAFQRVMNACKREALAEASCYIYERGGTKVTGPSIRLAEAIAQNWGNLEFGIVELEQRDGESSVMAFAWDLETNTRQTKVFTVPHMRFTKKGSYKLEDPRDIYEMVANQGARRLRACVLGVVPGDIVDAAVDQCEKTLQAGGGEPLIDRIRKMVAAFADQGVTQEMIEARLNHKLDAVAEQELVTLRKIYTSIKDGYAKREEWFPVNLTKAAPAPGTGTDNVPMDDPTPTAKPQPKAEVKPTKAPTAPPAPPAQAPAPAPTSPASDEEAAKKNSALLAKRCVEAGITEEEFLAWGVKGKHFGDDIASIDDLVVAAPNKLRVFVRTFPEVIKPQIINDRQSLL